MFMSACPAHGIHGPGVVWRAVPDCATLKNRVRGC
jgi:hypothetical protein